MKKILLTFCSLSLALASQAKLNVVATTPDLGSIAQAIGGDKIDLVVLAKPTEDPHFVDAKPSLIVKLNHADAVIEGGAELEVGWLPALLDQSRNPKLDAGKPGHISTEVGVQLMGVPATLDRSKGDIHASGNPHYSSDPVAAKASAQDICTSLMQIDPKNADYFQANLKKFDDTIDAKLVQWKAALAPYQGKDVVSYHDLWPYFAQEFGLKMDVFLEPKPGIPPTPAHLAQVITKMKADKIGIIVVQPYQNRKTAETVASHTGATVVDFPHFPVAGQSYVDWVDGLVNSLVKAFSAKK